MRKLARQIGIWGLCILIAGGGIWLLGLLTDSLRFVAGAAVGLAIGVLLLLVALAIRLIGWILEA